MNLAWRLVAMGLSIHLLAIVMALTPNLVDDEIAAVTALVGLAFVFVGALRPPARVDVIQ